MLVDFNSIVCSCFAALPQYRLFHPPQRTAAPSPHPPPPPPAVISLLSVTLPFLSKGIVHLSSFVIWLLLRIVFCSSHVVLTVWCFFFYFFFKCVFTLIELHHFPSSPSSLHQPPAPLSQTPAVLPPSACCFIPD